MSVLLEHPKHGRTHVYSLLALEQHLAAGWVKVEAPKEKTLHLPKKAK